MILSIYRRLLHIVEEEFEDIVQECRILFSASGRPRKLRIFLLDDTFVDVWYSPDGKYSYHWNNAGVRSYVYRHDNAPHESWRKLNTFPKHCHEGDEDEVVESFIPDEPDEALRYFMRQVRKKILEFRTMGPRG